MTDKSETDYRRVQREILVRHMSESKLDLEQEAKLATEMLKGKVVSKLLRHREGEVGIEFTDGTRLFIDTTDTSVELSITGGK